MNGLTSSVCTGHGGLSALNASVTTQGFDEHFVGAMPSLLLNTLTFTAFSACLLELVSVLKANGLYEDTVIEVNSEFNRNPNNDQGGSGHGAQAASVTYFSGAITSGPFVVGDIMADPSHGSQYISQGTWGQGIGMAYLGGRTLIPAHGEATLASLVGVASPTSTASSVVQNDGSGKFVPISAFQRPKIR
jgi:uncharacterized protein (DUF1501 family)